MFAGKEKGESTCKEPGVMPLACGERYTKVEPEILASPQFSSCGQPLTSQLVLARRGHGRSGSRSGLEVMKVKTT